MGEKKETTLMDRRNFLKTSALVAGTAFFGAFLAGCGQQGQSSGSQDSSKSGGEEKKDDFPKRSIEAIIPTSEGGSSEIVARCHGEVWGKLLGTNLTYSFYPGAAGEVAYTLFSKKPADGYSVLFGNLGAETAMYVLQKPKFKFEDLIFFCTLTVDPAVLLVRKDSPIADLKAFVAEAKKRKLTMGTSRWGSIDTIGGLLMAKQAGFELNMVPYGGGEKARLALLQGEIDILLTKLAAAQKMLDQVRFIGIFQEKNEYPDLSGKCSAVNEALGTSVPEIASYRHWVLPAALKKEYPERYNLLTETAAKAYSDPKFKELLASRGQPVEMYNNYIGEERTMKTAKDLLALAEEYKDVLQGEEKDKK